MGKYQKVREVIRDVMKDGKVHTAEEMERICEKRGIKLYNNRGPIYNIVHQLKQKGEIVSDGENGYLSIASNGLDAKLNSKHLLSESGQVDLSEFEVVRQAVRKKAKQVVSVFETGDVAINDALIKQLKVKELEIRIKKDCKQLLILPDGEVKLEIGKNSRFKNYDIYEKLKNKRVKFPVYYVGEWDEKNKFWLGDMTAVNPNKTTPRNLNK